MDETNRQHYETQSRELRVKLKEWELEFAKSHGGAKPTRDDIKANPKIASYSKRYHRLRDVLSGKIPHTQLDGQTQDKKRKPHAVPAPTPSSKRFRPAETPSSRQHTQIGLATPRGAPAAGTAAAAAVVTPSLNRKLFTPAAPTSIGPTPQRDGRVLGLFDLLPFKDAEIDSPSRPKRAPKAPQASEAVQETPRRGRTIDTGVGIPIDLDRTPSSRSTRQQQPQQQPQQLPGKSILSTPLKDRSNRVAKTPSTSRSVSKLQFQTPAFLRRIPMSKISENNVFASPEPIRLPRKPLVRGLSSIMADLRKTQQDQLDEEMDLLREMENEGASAGPAKKKPCEAPPGGAQPPPAAPRGTSRDDHLTETILAEDTQKQNFGLLGGFDDEGMYDSEDGDQEGLDRNGMPLRVFKKKGQKRTTRRVNMKPVMARRPPAAGLKREPEPEEDGETIPSKQIGNSAPAQQGIDDDADLLSGSDFAGSDYDGDEDELALGEPRLPRKAAGGSPKTKTAPPSKQKQGNKGGEKPEGNVKKAARKVNELAHANFKRLKLRNSGAKGGQGFSSRFRRRR
jgi:DNA replication regulator SLD2